LALRSPSRRSRNVRAMGIRERPISFRSPRQSICGAAGWYRAARELDRMLIFGEAHLRQILRSYAAYYEIRTHLAFGKDTRWVGRSSGPAPLSLSQSCMGYTTITSGCNLRKGQVIGHSAAPQSVPCRCAGYQARSSPSAGRFPDILSLPAEDMLANARERNTISPTCQQRPPCALWQPPSRGDGSASRLTSR
jgi:hypothetical protein